MTISSSNFDPSNTSDLNYIFDVINNATWPESTQKRFKQDVENLLLNLPHLPQNITIPESVHEELKDLSTGWLTMMESVSVDHVLADRYFYKQIYIIDGTKN